MKKPMDLFVACGLLILYITLDLFLNLQDSRSDAQAVLIAFLVYPAVAACLVGNHFGYFFCALLSGLLLLAPVFATANAPDRLLTPVDIPVALILLFLFLRKPMREFFSESRRQWQEKRARKLAAYDHLEPVFPDSNSMKERGTNALFWRNGHEYLMFINSGGMRAYRLSGVKEAEIIRKRWLTMLEQHLKLTLVLVPVVVLGFLAFSWHAYNTGEESIVYVALPMLLVLPSGLFTPLRQSLYIKQLKKQLTPTQLTITPMALMDKYANLNRKQQEKSKKTLLVVVGGFLVLMAVFSLVVSPKIMEKRRLEGMQAQVEMPSEK